MTIELFNKVSNLCSKTVTIQYSTSFASAIKLLHKDLREPIFNIYGFVRFADEIVDTFHLYDKKSLLEEFKIETFESINRKISLNPILNSFQATVNKYEIDHDLIHAFFKSMESDLNHNNYDKQAYDDYIYGSAEVVGLMCLYIFCEGNKKNYEKLKLPASYLGAAFQKVNFLRDIKSDFNELSRMYFPACNFYNFTYSDKSKIESDIEQNFKNAFIGVAQLPIKARFGVYVAYKYYYSLFNKIKNRRPNEILRRRIRIPNYYKFYIIIIAGLKNKLRLI